MLKNYTPHLIVIEKPDGSRLDLPSLGVIRAKVKNRPRLPVEEIPVTEVVYEEVEGVPADLHHDDVLVVSMLARDVAIASDHPEAWRMLSPDSGPSAIRNEKGQIVAVKGLLASS